MKFVELQQYDSSLQLIYPDVYKEDISGPASITSVDDWRAGRFLFIKDKKFLNRFKASVVADASILKKMGLVLQEDLLNQSQDLQELKAMMGFIASTKDVNLSICYLSKPFYDLKFGSLNDLIDGRQLNSSEIHSSVWIAQQVFIGESVKIGAEAKIYAGAVIMSKSVIGAGTIIYPNVVIYPYSEIGMNCRIHAGVVIGADGFGYHFHQGNHLKIWHLGGVKIGNNVEIGAMSAVDMGTFSPTLIGDGTKIDNQVQIGHNGRIGKGVIICGQVGLSGSVTLGDFCVVGGKAGFGPDTSVGAGSQVAGSAMVNSDWPDRSVIAGHPARPVKEWLKGVAYVRKESLSKSKEDK